MSDEHTPDQPEPERPTPEPPASAPLAATPTDPLAAFDVDRGEILSALKGSGIGLVTGLVAGVVTILLAIVAEGGSDWPRAMVWITGPIQLVAMAFGGSFTMNFGGGNEEFDFGGSVSYGFIPLCVLLPIVLVLYRSVRRSAPTRVSSLRRDLTTAGAVGVATAIVVWLVAFILRVDLSDSDGEFTAHAADFRQIVGTVLVVAAAIVIARRHAAGVPARRRLPVAARDALRAATVHVIVFSAVATVYVAILLITEGEAQAVVALPAAVLNVVPSGLAIGHLGVLEFGGFGELLGESGGGSASLWLFSGDAPWQIYVLPAIAIVAVVLAGCVLYLRGEGRARSHEDWAWTAGVFALLGVACSFFGHVSVGGGGSGFGGALGFGPAPWFFLVMAVWGLLAEVVRRTIAPVVVGSLPAGVKRRLRGPGDVTGVAG